MKVLIIRLSSIGDIILTSPVIRNLKNQFDGSIEIHFVVLSRFVSTIEHNPYISKIWPVEESVKEVIPSLIAENFDHVIDLHNNVRSAQIRRSINANSSTVNKQNIKKWLLVNNLSPKPISHIVERYLDTIVQFNINNDNQGLDYFLPPDSKFDIEEIDERLKSNNYIAWVIGAKYQGKRFSIEKHIEVIEQFKQPIVLLGGVTEVDDAEKMINHLGANIINRVGKETLHGSAAIIKNAKLIVAPDTGLMHIAAAFKKNIVSLWGCTTPSIGMAPYYPGEQSVIIEPLDLKKRPCSKLGNRCKYKGGCINRISAESVFQEVEKIFTS